MGVGVAALLLASPALALNVTLTAARPAPVASEVTLDVAISGAAGDVTVTWTFGDGTTLGPAQNATQARHAWASAGHYPVIVSVRDQVTTRGASFLQTIHEPLTAGAPAQSTTIVYDAAPKRIYSVNPDNDSVTIVDATGLVKLGEVATFDHPRSLALAPNGRLWVSHQADFAIAIVNPDRQQMVGVIDLPYASQPLGLVMSPTGDAAYVALRAVGKLLKLDPKSGEVLGEVAVGPFPHALAVSHDGQRIFGTRFISPQDHGEVFEVDAASFELVRTLELVTDTALDTDTSGRGVPNFLAAIAVSPDGLRAWVTAKKDNTLRGLFRDGQPLTPENAVRSVAALLDLSANAERLGSRIDIDNRNLPSAIAFTPVGDYAFIAIEGNDMVEIRDAYTGESRGALRDAGAAPMGLALAPDGKLFVHAFLSRTVVVFDVSTVLDSSNIAGVKLAEIGCVEQEALSPQELEGKRMFENSADPRMSREGYLSCATCHIEGFEDGRVFDFTARGEGLRNTTSLLGRRGTGQGRLHWTANFDELQDFEHDIRNAFGGTGFLDDALFYEGTRNQTLGDPKAGLSAELDALAAYVTSLEHVRNSPFRNPDGTLTEAAQAGKVLFSALACDRCHAGPDFTDSAGGELHDVGTISAASGQRLGAALTGFDTPTLLGAWETAPYLHDGSAPTLRDVLITKNLEGKHGATAGLSEEELGNLEAYLLQIDSELPVRTLPTFAPEEEEPRHLTAEGGCGCRVATDRTSTPMHWLGALFALALVERRRPIRPKAGGRSRDRRRR